MNDHEWIVEVTPAARAAISHEIKAQWDGRELGGPLVGHTDGERIVVTDANGVGVGVETPRGETWMLPARGRWLDFALACRADIVGDWHCHPGGSTTVPSDRDVKSWQATREVLGSRAYVGLIFVPRKVLVQGIHYDEVAWSFRQPQVGEYLVTQAGYQRANFVLSGEDRHEGSVYQRRFGVWPAREALRDRRSSGPGPVAVPERSRFSVGRRWPPLTASGAPKGGGVATKTLLPNLAPRPLAAERMCVKAGCRERAD